MSFPIQLPMKKTCVLAIVAAMSAAPCFSGALFDDPRVFPVLIGHDKGMGSGCFLQLSNSVYLITAKHVLFRTARRNESSGTDLTKRSCKGVFTSRDDEQL